MKTFKVLLVDKREERVKADTHEEREEQTVFLKGDEIVASFRSTAILGIHEVEPPAAPYISSDPRIF